MLDPHGSGEHRLRLVALQRSTQALLAGLDELGLHQAAAYMSMSLDTMRRAGGDPRPDLVQTG